MMHTRTHILTLLALLLGVMQACRKEPPPPDNPYDSIDRGDTTKYGIPVDSLTITFVHQKVLLGKCALPGCHVGNFEPDFRTPQSSFSTLVYAPVTKNNAAQQFRYRVVPFDTAYSVLHERITNCCFVNYNDRMPQDNIGNALPDTDIDLIASWIMYGARDMFGNIPKLPNAEPTIEGYIAFDTISLLPPFAVPSVFYNENRLDNIFYNPFIVPQQKSVFYVAISVKDDSTAQNQMQYNKLKISTHPDDFSNAWTYTGTFVAAGNYQGWLLTIPTANLPANDTLFMRYYVNDGHHAQHTEFPRNEHLLPYKLFWSFIRN
ncbi:MAG: hypothetical protein NZM35_11695 [Chitinophagales bacterium]|nr:hypothetical protein [Chitinophagales bacterium]MDW8419250.1 hypothetical protein [Chitinophagales bacterium]